MSYWYEQLTKIKGNEQIIPMAQKLEIKINGNVLWRDFLDSNDLSVEDFWIVLYFQTLPYVFSSLEADFDDLLFGIQRYF
ncbi:unnamed protein product [Rhizophagus irregularis]|uniref:Uncharacterized protein n=1 Tax=Rhizophagus irregularis TaxID=588596 RepID=A0A915ZYJ9_9GLOM|nr:unnamed protein product [Rhizophagus irregularis]